MQEIFLYFPFKAREELSKFDSNSLEEIRIRNNRPIFLKIGQDEVRTGYTIHTEEILEKVKENENKAMEQLSESERETLMSLTKKYVTCFKDAMLKG